MRAASKDGKRRFPAIGFALACTIFAVNVAAQASGPQPGATDPIGSTEHLNLFRDDKVVAFQPSASTTGQMLQCIYNTDQNNLKLGSPICSPAASLQNPIVAASGRILDPAHASIATAQRYGGTSQVVVNVTDPRLTSIPPFILPYGNLADRTLVGTDPIAIAVGDVDKALDANYNYHDEVVLAYLTNDNAIALVVLNYTKALSGVKPGAYIGGIVRPAISNIVSSDNPLGVAIGDFDGDGNNEIAVTLADNNGFDVFIYKLSFDPKNPTFDGENYPLVSSFPLAVPTSLNSSGETAYLLADNSTVADDFNGDYSEELAIGFALRSKQPAHSRVPDEADTMILHVAIDNNLKLSNYSSTRLAVAAKGPDEPILWQRPYHLPTVKLQLAAGQFLFNPPATPFGQHQLVAASTVYDQPYQSGQINLQLLTASSNSSAFASSASPLKTAIVPDYFNPRFALAAGGFLGNANIQNPIEAVSVSAFSAGTNYILATFQPASGGALNQIDSEVTNIAYALDGTVSFPLVASDWKGLSVYLGAPVHITLENAISTDYILEEPPKHSYWDGTVVQTITNYDTNTVTFSSSTGTTSSTKSTDHSNWTIGGSVEASAGGTVGVQEDAVLAKTDDQASIDVTAKASYQYNQDKSHYDSSYSGRTFTIGSATDEDDTLAGRLQTIDVWRYRMYGISQKDPRSNTFYDIMLPGPITPFHGAGKDFPWYQPVHENGNILTYPQAFNSQGGNSQGGNPPDVGTWTDPVSNTSYSGVLVPPANWFFDATSGNESIALNQGSASGDSFDYSHTLSESLDVKASASAKAEIAGVSGEVRVSGDVSFNNSNSWGTAQTSDNTTSTSTTITLTKGPVDSSYAYEFTPITYIAQDGTFKMSFIVPNPSGDTASGGNFWNQRYGGAPDPALNLPSRFQPTYLNGTVQNGWEPNTISSVRKKMRGLFFRKAQANPVTHDFDFLNGAAVTGDKVRIEARVYNESVSQEAQNITVQFQKIAYDASTDSEICDVPINAGLAGGLICPASARTLIGESSVSSLQALQFTCLSGTDNPQITGCDSNSVFFNWDTTASGPEKGSTATNSYRIYVVLVPDSQNPKELYGNDGIPVSIQNMTNSAPIKVTTANPHNLHTGDWVTIGETGLQLSSSNNQIFQVTYVNDTNFTLNNTTDVPGTYSGHGTFTPFNPGENDEGYAEFEIQGSPGLEGSPGGQQYDDYLKPGSLRAKDLHTDKLQSVSVSAYQHRPLRLRVAVFSSIAHPEGAHLLLFDGDPAKGASAIAGEQVHPGNNGGAGTYVWFNWTPNTTGTHHLYAELVEGGSDVKIGNAVSSLQVDVFTLGDVNGDGKINRADLNELLQNVGKAASQSSCGPACDLNNDGFITVLDVRKLVLMCGPTACGEK